MTGAFTFKEISVNRSSISSTKQIHRETAILIDGGFYLHRIQRLSGGKSP